MIRTVGIIDSLIRLTFSTAAPAAIWYDTILYPRPALKDECISAMFNLLFSQIYPGNIKLISAGFNQLLPKLYAFSMMWTLNARRSILKGNSRLYTSDSSTPRARPVSDIGYLGALS